MISGRQTYLQLHPPFQPTFDNFIVGLNEAVVQALQERISGGSGDSLLILGDSGMGKTHLLLAASALLQAKELPAVYFDATQTTPTEAKKWSELSDNHWLLLDNIHHIAGQRQLETALMACIEDAQVRRNYTLIGSSNLSAQQMKLVWPDLLSRLELLPLYPIQMPDDEVLLNIIQDRAAIVGFEIPDHIGRFWLTRLPRDPGSWIAAYSRLEQAILEQGRMLTRELASECSK